MKSIVKEVFETVAEVGELTTKQKNTLTVDDKLSAYGFDWIDECEIILTLENKLKLIGSVQDGDLKNLKTVGDVVELFKEKRKKRKTDLISKDND